MNVSELYHYTESGLDNVYLAGGFSLKELRGEQAVLIHNVDGLHRIIGSILVESQRRLSGKEIRFIRSELLLSQKKLASILGLETQAVARWEKGVSQVGLADEVALRMLFKESIGGNQKLTDMLNLLADLEDEMYRTDMVFDETELGWSSAA